MVFLVHYYALILGFKNDSNLPHFFWVIDSFHKGQVTFSPGKFVMGFLRFHDNYKPLVPNDLPTKGLLQTSYGFAQNSEVFYFFC